MACPPMTVMSNKWDYECSKSSTILATINVNPYSEVHEKEIKQAPYAESVMMNQRMMLVHGAQAVFSEVPLRTRTRNMMWLPAAVSPSWSPVKGRVVCHRLPCQASNSRDCCRHLPVSEYLYFRLFLPLPPFSLIYSLFSSLRLRRREGDWNMPTRAVWTLTIVLSCLNLHSHDCTARCLAVCWRPGQKPRDLTGETWTSGACIRSPPLISDRPLSVNCYFTSLRLHICKMGIRKTNFERVS